MAHARFVFVMAFTGPHAEEALNVLLSLRRAGVFGSAASVSPKEQEQEQQQEEPRVAKGGVRVLIYSALSDELRARFTSISRATEFRRLHIPAVNVESKEASHATRGFSQIVQGKFVALENALSTEPGAYIVWLDTDIYFFSDPRRMLLVHAAAHRSKYAHFQQSTHNACTGFFMITPERHAEGRDLLRRAKAILQAHLALGPNVRYRGDESCINEVISKGRVPVSYFSRDLFPNGRDYFNRGKRAKAVLVHNNFIRGLSKKVARFKAHGLWLVPSSTGATRSSGDGGTSGEATAREGAASRARAAREAEAFRRARTRTAVSRMAPPPLVFRGLSGLVRAAASRRSPPAPPKRSLDGTKALEATSNSVTGTAAAANEQHQARHPEPAQKPRLRVDASSFAALGAPTSGASTSAARRKVLFQAIMTRRRWARGRR
jgi:hypothetical protein